MALAQSGKKCPRVVVLESRSTYTHDRTWCFFKNPAAPVRPWVEQEWPAMQITTPARSVTIDCGLTPYQMVPAGRFYEEARRLIDPCSQMALRLGTRVIGEPEKRRDLWRVETSAGPVEARYVIDTRPGNAPRRDGAVLWQSFYGQEIECEAQVFNPACGELMDFSAADAAGGPAVFPDAVCFVYLLALSPTRALIEFTVFGADPLGPEAFDAVQEKAVAQRVGNNSFSVLRCEHGVLPMGAAPFVPNDDPSYVRAGLTAGGARPSTGYAFARIQRWAAACAAALADGKAPTGHAPDGWALRTMDRLFLNVLRAQPALAPGFFMALFERVSSQRLIRFLSDQGTLADYAAVVAALPAAPFLRSLLKPCLASSRQAAAAVKQ